MVFQHPFQKSLQLCPAVSPILVLGVPLRAVNSTLERPKLCDLVLPPVFASVQQAAEASTPASRLFNPSPSSAISVFESTQNYQCATIFLEHVKPAFSTYVASDQFESFWGTTSPFNVCVLLFFHDSIIVTVSSWVFRCNARASPASLPY